jgi:hypothetical protein
LTIISGPGTCLPQSQSQNADLQAVSSEWIEDQIRKDIDVRLDGVLIAGDIDLGGEESLKSISSSIFICNSTFNGDISAENVILRGSIILERNSINGLCRMNKTEFQNFTSFNATVFGEDAYFRGSKFWENAYFYKSSFERTADFSNSHFLKEADFDLSGLNDASFMRAIFDKYARFGSTRFNGQAVFSKARFLNDSCFYSAKFNCQTDFKLCRFMGADADFSRSHFTSPSHFSGAVFNDVSFSYATFEEDAEFYQANITGIAKFNSTKFNKNVNFNKAEFGSNIILRDTAFGKLYLHWNATSGHLPSSELSYEFFNRMIQNYKDLNWPADLMGCYYDYRVWQERGRSFSDPWKYADIFLDESSGYGTKPQRVIPWLAGIILIFGVVYWSNGGVCWRSRPNFVMNKVLSGRKISVRPVFESDVGSEVVYIAKGWIWPMTYSIYFSFLVMFKYFSLLPFWSRNTQEMLLRKDSCRTLATVEAVAGFIFLYFVIFYIGNQILSYFTPSP